MKRSAPFRALVVGGLLAGGVVLAMAQDEDAKLNAFFQHYEDAHFRQEPTEATLLGDHRFDNLMEDLSKAARGGLRVRHSSTIWRYRGSKMCRGMLVPGNRTACNGKSGMFSQSSMLVIFRLR